MRGRATLLLSPESAVVGNAGLPGPTGDGRPTGGGGGGGDLSLAGRGTVAGRTVQHGAGSCHRCCAIPSSVPGGRRAPAAPTRCILTRWRRISQPTAAAGQIGGPVLDDSFTCGARHDAARRRPPSPSAPPARRSRRWLSRFLGVSLMVRAGDVICRSIRFAPRR